MLVYLVREVPFAGEPQFSAALEMCHWEQNLPYAVNAGLSGDQHLVFSTNLSETEFDIPTIEQVLGQLANLHDRALEGSTP